ncbi:hypothetical protein CDAR_58681 [Caerostris darwini]|uniref:C2H2-type domain-containing protein n=1 Tax=Caerostris darwini TaxID=1538125 RepID=A0AAV4S631_9ARAC|nr:hypothetical protein CDAR_58681 [Caerostris darwini]
MSRRFRCPYCNYSSNNKTNLTLHLYVHRNSLAADELADSSLTTPSLDRYCATCDVQFALYENYQASFYERIARKKSIPSIESDPLFRGRRVQVSFRNRGNFEFV